MKKNLLLMIALLCAFIANAQTDDNSLAMQLVKKQQAAIGLSDEELNNVIVSNSYFNQTSGTQLVYLQQSYKGIPVYNQLHVLAFKNGQLVSKSGGRIKGIEKKTGNNNGIPMINAETAVKSAMADRKLIAPRMPAVLSSEKNGHFITFDNMGISRENITAELMWVPLEDGKSVELAWQVYIIPNTSSDYWLVRVSAINQSIVGVSNLTVYCNWDDHSKGNCQHDHNKNHEQTAAATKNTVVESPLKLNTSTAAGSPAIVNGATYRVIPFPAESPNHAGGAHALRTDPWNAAPGNATTLKWHNNGTVDFTITRGNNVWAQEDRNGNNGTGTAATSSTNPDPLTFDFTPNFTVTPTQVTPNPNQQFSITNLFYWNNIIHDVMYLYGFDEVSGNFQASNLGRGGNGNDYVLADAQDGGGTNNANFSTPADGGNGRMQMYLWSGNPQKDGDLDNGIVTHEFAHGISNRLTGGPAQAGCLGNAEQMGEGWSDYYSLMFTQDWAGSNLNTGFNSPRGIGTYAVGQTPTGTGIRSQKYCTNFAVNNKVYAGNISAQQHNRGEIWCATLWDMTWNIINQVGSINPNIYDVAGGGGNTIALKLVTEGMKLQPCSPGFIDGRDAILQADQILYNGAYSCAIREAFRRRGMGAFASQGSSASVTDQQADFSAGSASVLLTQNVIEIPEGQNIVYTNRVTTSPCGGVTNFLITDTLPANVTYVSGGTYNATNRVVSFPVTLGAGQTQDFVFTVQVNNGAYYPTVNLFEDNVPGPTIPATWTTNSTTSTNWSISNTRSFSPTSSFFSSNLDVQSDQKLTLTNAIALTATPPPLTFRHWYSTESQYDGGVLEISTNDGATWTDMQTNILNGGYTAAMDATTLLANRNAWSGSSNNKFIKTKVNLTPFANQSVKIRFRFTSDVGTNLEGWYIDNIAIKDQAVVEMQSNLFNATNFRVQTSDTVTVILPANTCTNATITTAPSNVNACAGSNATFTAVIAGSNPVYQWQISTDGGTTFTNISGANAATFTVNNVTSAQNNYQYRLQVSNACPSNATSTAATLTVSDPAAITSQPAAQVLCAGGNASFTVAASGSANTYQWQVSTDGGATFSDISGATSATLTISNAAASLNNNQYHVVISSCNPTPVTSSNVTLTVNSEASIVSQPVNTSACEGGNASFSATVSGTTLTYQWQISTDGGVTFTDISGAIAATLSLTGVTASMNNNSYRVIVTSTACAGTVTSTAAVLSVNNNAAIIAQPTANSVCPGSNTLFTVNATGAGITYQWQISTDGGTTYTNISGETSASLNLTNVTASINGNLYRVIINSSCSSTGITSNAAQLTILSTATLNSQPAAVSVCQNQNATFTVNASGSSLTYQWRVSTDGGNTYSDISGATTNTLSLTGVTPALNNNRYQVVVTGVPCGSVTSDPALLQVSTPAQISAQPTSVTACSGTDASFSVGATGSLISYQWQVSTDGGSTFNNIPGATNANLTLTAVANTLNNNVYQAVVTEANCGAVTSNAATLTVNALPVVTVTADPSTALSIGQSATLTASSTPAASTYSWFLNGSQIPGQSASTFVVAAGNPGAYTATITDINGCANSSNAITITDTVYNYTFIYPNPNNGHFNVRFEGVPYNGLPRKLSMYDSKGARVYVKDYAITTSYQIMEVSVEKFSSGVYMVVLSDASGTTLATGKVLIQ
jgi:hypothetical protein